jgi:Uma2 family endonuclease
MTRLREIDGQPLPAPETLPTMYDLPSEDPEEPGLPDEFHLHQPQLLRETFIVPGCDPSRVFVATDLNLYYDPRHTLWYKRPDWFAVVGGTRFYEQRDLRLSYVMWQERIAPYLMVELLSPGTEQEDLGQRGPRPTGQPPSKWEVYERYLKVPYYVVYSRFEDRMRAFVLSNGRYQEQTDVDERLWLPEIGIGIGIWHGDYAGFDRAWLRFYNADGGWIARPIEQERRRAEREHHRAEREQQRADEASRQAERQQQQTRAAFAEAERMRAKLRALGIDPDA